jgi:hypothetical protein
MGLANPNGQRHVPNRYKEDTGNTGKAASFGVYIGIVKDNVDPQNMGRLRVYIKEFGGDPEKEATWLSVSYASPFAGSTSIFDQGSNVTEYEDTMKSYGFWAVPPDIDSRVLVGFNAGKLEEGYWFACLYQRGTQVSVPGIPAKNTYAGENVPAAPKNKKDLDPDLEKYVEHKPMSDALKRQGLENDNVRGTTSSSATRESPSKVLGILTPGQHQFVMDDGDSEGKNKLIRLRTTNGTQILLDDTEGHIYLITKNGENWVELSVDGRIHIYGTKDISVRSEASINLYADKDINMQAGRSINAKTDFGSINFESANEFNSLAATNTKLTSGISSNINSGVAHYETAGVIHMNGPVATPADTLPEYLHVFNHGVLNSICSTVPEHEPWGGHSGSVNPIGPGNQQMQQDPAPDQTPRQPEQDEQPVAVQPNQDKEEDVDLEDVAVSPLAQDVIKEINEYTPVNLEDADGQSAGFGTNLIEGSTVEPSEFGGSLPTANTQLGQTTPDQKLRGFEVPLPAGQGQFSLSAETFARFDAAMGQAGAANNVAGGVGGSLPNLGSIVNSVTGQLGIAPNNISGQNFRADDLVGVLTQGVTGDKANAMFANDIKRDETAVKKVLSTAGVDKIPQNVFDGLVSFQNQTKDISYAYVKGEKIDLTPMYRNKQWDRVASFIAADERDRPRRAREAAMIAGNNYGIPLNSDFLVTKGLDKAVERLNKGKFNPQTGAPATDQQLVAVATTYYEQRGEPLPNQSFAFNKLINQNLPSNQNGMNAQTGQSVQAKQNALTEQIAKIIKRRAGPWPY